MGDLTDETLMAFADGRLTEAETADVEAAIAARPDLQARVAVYRTTGRNLAVVFDEARLGPVPDAVLAAIGAGGSGPRLNGSAHAAAAGGATVVDLHAARSARQARRNGTRTRTWTLAACCAGLIGAAVLAVVQANAPSISGLAEMVAFDGKALFRTSALGEVLEREARAEAVSILGASNERWMITPTATFKARDQRWCREYDAQSSMTAGPRIMGLACRRQDGRWTIEAQAEPAPVATAPGSPTVKPASGPSSTVEAAAERIRAGDMLDAAQVSRLVAGGWKDVQP